MLVSASHMHYTDLTHLRQHFCASRNWMQEGAVRNDFRLDIAKFLIPFIFSHTGDDLIYLTTFLNMEKLCVCVCVCVRT